MDLRSLRDDWSRAAPMVVLADDDRTLLDGTTGTELGRIDDPELARRIVRLIDSAEALIDAAIAVERIAAVLDHAWRWWR